MKVDTPIVKGAVVFEKTIPAFENATIHVQLEDISRAGAGAILLAEEIIANVKYVPGAGQTEPTVIPFEIYLKEGEQIDPRNFYGIRVWVDIDSDGEASSKDLNSDQSLRVLTQGFGNFIEVRF